MLIATLAAPTRLGHHFYIALLQAVVLSNRYPEMVGLRGVPRARRPGGTPDTSS